MIALVRKIGIALMIAAFPFWVLWVGCGMLADRAERRSVSVVKGKG